MAGYALYSLDWARFSAMGERPTERERLPAVERVAGEGRMLFVQVDT